VGNKDLEMPGGEAEFVGGMGGMGGGGGPLPFAASGGGGGPGCGPGGMGCGPGGTPCFPGPTGAMPAGTPSQFIAGMTAPQYGMPISGTPIGLPGPPHVPLGVPAGLQKHVMVNHTKMHIPGPTKKLKIDVKEEPGFSYPEPVSHIHITEKSHVPPVIFRQPISDKHEHAFDVPDDSDCE
jgi:hypothetical protein